MRRISCVVLGRVLLLSSSVLLSACINPTATDDQSTDQAQFSPGILSPVYTQEGVQAPTAAQDTAASSLVVSALPGQASNTPHATRTLSEKTPQQSKARTEAIGSDVTMLQSVSVRAEKEGEVESDEGAGIIPQTSNLGKINSDVVLYSRMMQDRLQNLKSALMKIYGKWKGTPYRWGGASKKGIDCSAFVQTAFRSAFKYDLPRTTQTQIQVGLYVKKQDLRVGDVLFFKTGPHQFHNGIYLGNNEFMHSSTTYGVKISRLDSRYWQKRYIKARRFLNSFEAM
ncbi:NlpC/P60 family protein [Thiomicrorhabdus heinhorstiae]|uniref:C40 family peptidase n=1 Tax=Thiomicrorhabdus heinhorstiae TaxID=2748010 RepID=A0ABS0BVT9_9GAMM|nr:NlpC/P60 family protein [Thiomicrorhabdus heinhorstiae]MBF6057895.1 C40 family peptidase [Thiomicrorhabdus heinhorstiae]